MAAKSPAFTDLFPIHESSIITDTVQINTTIFPPMLVSDNQLTLITNALKYMVLCKQEEKTANILLHIYSNAMECTTYCTTIQPEHTSILTRCKKFFMQRTDTPKHIKLLSSRIHNVVSASRTLAEMNDDKAQTTHQKQERCTELFNAFMQLLVYRCPIAFLRTFIGTSEFSTTDNTHLICINKMYHVFFNSYKSVSINTIHANIMKIYNNFTEQHIGGLSHPFYIYTDDINRTHMVLVADLPTALIPSRTTPAFALDTTDGCIHISADNDATTQWDTLKAKDSRTSDIVHALAYLYATTTIITATATEDMGETPHINYFPHITSKFHFYNKKATATECTKSLTNYYNDIMCFITAYTTQNFYYLHPSTNSIRVLNKKNLKLFIKPASLDFEKQTTIATFSAMDQHRILKIIIDNGSVVLTQYKHQYTKLSWTTWAIDTAIRAHIWYTVPLTACFLYPAQLHHSYTESVYTLKAIDFNNQPSFPILPDTNTTGSTFSDIQCIYTRFYTNIKDQIDFVNTTHTIIASSPYTIACHHWNVLIQWITDKLPLFIRNMTALVPPPAHTIYSICGLIRPWSNRTQSSDKDTITVTEMKYGTTLIYNTYIDTQMSLLKHSVSLDTDLHSLARFAYKIATICLIDKGSSLINIQRLTEYQKLITTFVEGCLTTVNFTHTPRLYASAISMFLLSVERSVTGIKRRIIHPLASDTTHHKMLAELLKRIYYNIVTVRTHYLYIDWYRNPFDIKLIERSTTRVHSISDKHWEVLTEQLIDTINPDLGRFHGPTDPFKQLIRLYFISAINDDVAMKTNLKDRLNMIKYNLCPVYKDAFPDSKMKEIEDIIESRGITKK